METKIHLQPVYFEILMLDIRIHLDSGGRQEVKGCVSRGEDSDGVWAPQPLCQPGRPERRHQRGEGGVHGQGVEHSAGQAARA